MLDLLIETFGGPGAVIVIAMGFAVLAMFIGLVLEEVAAAADRRRAQSSPQRGEPLDPYRGVSDGPLTEEECPLCRISRCTLPSAEDRMVLRKRFVYLPPECWPRWYRCEVEHRETAEKVLGG